MRFSLSIVAAAFIGTAAVLAAPTQFVGCDLKSVQLLPEWLVDPKNASNTLAAPPTTDKLGRLVLGIGSQNYSCNAGVPVPNGAFAYLYDVSCSAVRNIDLVNTFPSVAVQSDPNSQSMVFAMFRNLFNAQFMVGVHYFKGDFTTPAFEFNERNSKFYGAVAGKISALPGSDMGRKPDAYGAVPSLRIIPKVGMGSTYTAVYRMHTAGGAAPTTCDWTGQKKIPYSALYWVFKA